MPLQLDIGQVNTKVALKVTANKLVQSLRIEAPLYPLLQLIWQIPIGIWSSEKECKEGTWINMISSISTIPLAIGHSQSI